MSSVLPPMVTRMTTSPAVHATEPAEETLCGNIVHDIRLSEVTFDLFADCSASRARLVHAGSLEEHVGVICKERHGGVDVTGPYNVDDSREHARHLRFGARIGFHVGSRHELTVEGKSPPRSAWCRYGPRSPAKTESGACRVHLQSARCRRFDPGRPLS